MGISKSFGGAKIRKPGAYSITKVDQSGGAPLGANGTLFLMGEAETGAPGDVEGIQRYNATQLADLIAEFGSGPIVDCARAALSSPSKTPGIGQADEVLVWKTNSSTQASLNLANSVPANVITVKDRNYGAKGNQISIKLENGTSASLQRIITVQRGDNKQVLAQNDAEVQLSIQYTGAGSAAALTIGGSLTNKTLTTTITGATPDNLSISLNDFATIKDLQMFIDAHAAYTCTLSSPQTATARSAKSLDPVTALDIMTAKSLYRLQQELVDRINDDAQLVMAEIATLTTSIPVASGPTFLTGGAKGASTSADFTDGMAKSLAVTYGVALPAISRDAAADITDGLTDASSTYDVDAVHAALDTHLRLRGSIKNRKEAQGMVGRRDSTIATSYAAAGVLSSELIQMCVQDVLVVDVSGELKWKQPHVMAALLAGIRLGTEIGEPLTHKFVSANGVGHAVNPVTGIAAGDFDPNTAFDVAIDMGVTFTEQVAGGHRVVVDNTTYGKDQSFVWNRGSVVEAAQYTAKTIRETAELVFVGQRLQNGALVNGKISGGAAKSISNVVSSKLDELWVANIISTSSDAPKGYKNLTVDIQGNTAKVKVHVKPVQGLDFILIEFELGDISQSA